MSCHHARDRGSILPIVLVVVVVLGAVVVATASYATGTLKYGQVVESRGDRLAASQAAMDDAIEQLSLRRGIAVCATGAGSGSGVSSRFPETINDAEATVGCELTGGSLPTSEGFSLAVTGVGVSPAVTLLEFNNGGKPEINGPIYVSDPSRVAFNQPTTIVEGDFWYPDTPCADPTGVETETVFKRSSITVNALNFDPPLTRGYYCVNRTWNQLFIAPPVDGSVSGLAAPTTGPTLLGGCTVWSPGLYSGAPPPLLTANNYFKSGIYHFDGIGPWVFDKQIATFGNSLIQGFPIIDNSPCDGPRGSDATTGATVYVSGDTQFDMDKTATGIEIAGRRQGNSIVAVHVLSTTLDPDSEGLFISGAGGGREIALNGLLWAPESALIFNTIPAKKAAALRGGAVIARLVGKIAASADGFVIEVPTVGGNTQLLLESTAVNKDGATTVRVVADYRPASGEVAIDSWRVCPPSSC